MGDNKNGMEFLGTGFSFPVMPDAATGRFMSSSFEEDIKEAIYIILMTKKANALCALTLAVEYMILLLLLLTILLFRKWKKA